METKEAPVFVEEEGKVSLSDWTAIAMQSKVQLDTSRRYKYPRMRQIQENENLYLGIAEKEYKNPYDYCYPYMAGFADYLLSEIDDAPVVRFEHTGEEDYRAALKITALFDQQAKSTLPHAQWAKKDRYSKKMAIFSGVGILKFYTEGIPNFKSVLSNTDHYDFHCEPAGGGDLESHLFCGEEGIFKTTQEVEQGAKDGKYNPFFSQKLLSGTSQQQYKDNADMMSQRLNRHRALGLDIESNNYVGQSVVRLVEWYTTYNGMRYYCLFNEDSGTAIRVEKLRDMFSIIEPNNEALYPYVVWHTHEDPRVFWSKAPADDVRPIAKSINKLLNQQLYNRDKQNMGHRLYDPTMIKDVKSLGDWRVDGLTPANSFAGQRKLSEATYTLQTGNLSGTVELVNFLDSWAGQKTGSSPSSQGNAPADQKVGIFYGELQQISKRLGLYNKSYKEAWASIGLRFRGGVKDNLTTNSMSIKLMGARGIEWAEIRADDLEPVKDYDIIVEGGNDTKMQKDQENQVRIKGLDSIATVNPKWKDMQKLKALGYTDEDIKEAFSIVDPGLKELLSEAAQAEQEIVEGKNPPINRGANAAFMQHILNFAENLSMKDKEAENETAIKLITYATQHAIIAAENEARSAMQLINEEKIKMGSVSPDGGAPAPMGGGPELPMSPSGEAISAGNKMTAQMAP